MSSKQNITAIIRDKRGRILAIGKNSYIKSHPLQAKHANKVGRSKAIYLHAEIAAIVQLKNLNQAYSIEILRPLKDGSLGASKPCPICMSAIIATPIKIINYKE